MRTDKGSYVFVKHPITGKRVAEHRLVMERELARPLDECEHVHHINRVKNDNRIGNLEVMTPEEHYVWHKRNKLAYLDMYEKLLRVDEERYHWAQALLLFRHVLEISLDPAELEDAWSALRHFENEERGLPVIELTRRAKYLLLLSIRIRKYIEGKRDLNEVWRMIWPQSSEIRGFLPWCYPSSI